MNSPLGSPSDISPESRPVSIDSSTRGFQLASTRPMHSGMNESVLIPEFRVCSRQFGNGSTTKDSRTCAFVRVRYSDRVTSRV